MKDLIIRKGGIDDLTQIKNLFFDTVKSICSTDYNNEQIGAWLRGSKDQKRWTNMVNTQVLLVATKNNEVLGFCSLANNNYVDFLFVHKNYQNLGIAKKLYSAIEDEAIRNKQEQLSADVSITAKHFFEKSGFKVIKEQTAVRDGCALTNYKMIKDLI
jgi:putative acetyltransferase